MQGWRGGVELTRYHGSVERGEEGNAQGGNDIHYMYGWRRGVHLTRALNSVIPTGYVRIIHDSSVANGSASKHR